MEERASVKLLGTKESIFTQRIVWALELKGISYEFVEQDFSSRSSPLLVELNPVYKKVPVIVHDGKSLAESLVILEYIEETWPLINPIFPVDPSERASSRFWAKFIDGKHLVDPIHHLTLLATIPSSSKCNACGKEIAGFSYTCATCSTYYHTLCLLALPLSIQLPSHCHKLDLEFCPPYDFECDLCKKPSYKGWLYHCSSCEFDAHISCAIARKTEKTGDKCDELMELLSIYMKGTEEISITQDQLQHQAQQTPSYQFSDGCFSIDLAKSQQLNDEQTGSHMTKEAVENKEKSNVAYVTLPNGIGSEVWMGLGREMEKAYQTNDSNKERLRSSCCPDILNTLFCLKK